MDKQEKQEKTLKIISLFRERESLWNKNSVSYRRNDVRKKALEEIAEKCNMTEEAVTKKLRALRSTYVMEKKKVDQSQKSGDVYQPVLMWYEDMSFLDESISKRKPKDNVSNNNLDESCSFHPDVSCAPSSSSRKRKYKKDIKTDTEFDKALKKLVNINKTDAFSSFADYMAKTLRSMPEKTAYLAMKDIQNILYQNKFPNPEVEGASTKQHTSSSNTRVSEIFPVKLIQN